MYQKDATEADFFIVGGEMKTVQVNELSRLPAQKQQEFVEEYNRKKKSKGFAYLLWLIGFHYLYL